MGGLRRDEIDDLVQECFVKLGTLQEGPLRDTDSFENEQAVLGYLKTLALNTVRDHLRKQTAEKRGAARTIAFEDRMHEIAGGLGANPDQSLLFSQIDDSLRADARDRAIFWLYYKQGLTTKEIAQIPAFGLSQKGVESALRRLTEAVQKKFAPEPEGKPGQKAFHTNG